MSSMVDKQEIIDMIRLKSPRLELVSFEAGKSEEEMTRDLEAYYYMLV